MSVCEISKSRQQGRQSRLVPDHCSRRDDRVFNTSQSQYLTQRKRRSWVAIAPPPDFHTQFARSAAVQSYQQNDSSILVSNVTLTA